MFIFAILVVIVWATWEKHATTKEYIYKKHPDIAKQNAERKALYAKINREHIETVRSMGYEISDDYEVVHYCGD